MRARTAPNPAWLLLIVLLCEVVNANGQAAPTLKSFFIAAHVVSDTSPFWSEYILDVQPTNSGSLVRHLRLSPATEFCPNNVAIRAVEKRTNTPPGSLMTTANPCSVGEKDFQLAVERALLKGRAIDETVRYTIVATCGSEERIFQVPYLQTFDLDTLHQKSPQVAEIVALYSNIVRRFFPNDPINGNDPPKDKQLQANAEKLVSLLKSGRFDKAFEPGLLNGLLTTYQGPIAALQPVSKLMDAGKWKFVTYVDPIYPPLRRPGKADPLVELELSVDSDTGRIRSLKILRGQSSYASVSTDAAIQWVFDAAQNLANPIKVTLDYSLSCKVITAKP